LVDGRQAEYQFDRAQRADLVVLRFDHL
jgi:hypothetical protein